MGHDDWCVLAGPDPNEWLPPGERLLAQELRRDARLLIADPGDLILWDSRTVHGGRLGSSLEEGAVAAGSPMPNELARMSCTVCMTPRAFADEATMEALRSGGENAVASVDPNPDTGRSVLSDRRKVFESGEACNHCPHEVNVQPRQCEARCKRAILDDTMNCLLDGQCAPTLPSDRSSSRCSIL